MAAPITSPNGNGVAGRIAASANDFTSIVWPVIEHKFGSGELVAVENAGGDVAQHLDYCGIDYLFHPLHGDRFGIGQRISGVDASGRPWDNFTIPCRAYERLCAVHARPMGRLAPAVLVQSCLTGLAEYRHWVSIGVVRTWDLLRYAGSHPLDKKTGSSDFFVWTFDDLEDGGIEIDRFPQRYLLSPFGEA
jgi:hypothetical protein